MFINPGLFTDKIVEYKEDNSSSELAYTKALAGNKFEIVINPKGIKDALLKSWLKSSADPEDVITAIELHEIGHLRYGSFDISDSLQTKMQRTLANIFEDARLEYKFSNEFPQYSMYFDLSISLIRDILSASASSTNSVKEVVKYINETFNIVRFGMTTLNDEEYVSLVVSLCTVCRRGSAEDTLKVVRFLEDFLCNKFNIPKEVVEQTVTNVSDIISNNKINNMGQSIDKDNKLKEIKNKSKSLRLERKKRKQKENDFYDCVIGKYRKQIVELRNIFKRILSQKKFIPAYDGEINLKKQQELFVSSKTMEECKGYLVNKLAKSGADVCILRDISGSTSNFADKYAEMATVCLASLDMIHGMRSMMVDFSDQATIIKTFDDKANEIKVEPKAGGGTHVAKALEVLEKIKFRCDKRMCIIITDGEYYNREYAEKYQKMLRDKLGIKFCRILIQNGQNSLSVEELPREVSKFIMEEIRK